MEQEFSLQINNISKSFGGIHALQDVSFNIRKGHIHALCGENGAGKSTLMKILSGELKRDSGEMLLNGNPIIWNSPHDALCGGIVIIAQELNPLLDMSIAENIFLQREPTRFGILDRNTLHRKAEEALKYFDLEFDVRTKMSELSVAQAQLVEIVKAISYNSEVIIMDEPTSAIGEQETKKLFDIIQKLKQEEKTIIYISHRMKEIFSIADDVTILRDSKHIITTSLKTLSPDELISHMIGQKITSSYFVTPKPLVETQPLLTVKNLSKKNRFNNINFILNEKEILGVFGLMGSGRSSMLNTIFGVEYPDEGKVILKDKSIDYQSPQKAISAGLGFVTEDRKGSGLIIDLSVQHNISLPSLTFLSYFGGLINKNKEKNKVEDMISTFNIKTSSPRQAVVNLSGGNQQKVVLGKWVLTSPEVLLLDEPTRGIDVGAKQEIYQFMNDYVEEGKGIIIVSSELPEIIAMSHRVLVFRKGKLVAERVRSEFNQDEFMNLVS